MTTQQRSNLITYVVAAASSLFFCSKGVFVKSAYAHDVDTITILTLRMAMAMPFFVLVAWLTSIGAERLGLLTWGKLAGLGFVGYYLSSLVNFSGLQYISVGLERIVLFTYPSIVLLLGVAFGKSKWNRRVLGPLALAYGGILFAFAGEAYGKGSAGDTAKGVALIFTSAVTYAGFILVGGELTKKIGAMRFTSIVVGFSCLFVLMHYAVTHPFGDLMKLSGPVYGHGAVLAIVGTVIPSFLMGVGLKRAGSEKFAIIGTIGPVGTVVLAWAVLGEALNVGQLLGFALSLGGGLMITLRKGKVPGTGDDVVRHRDQLGANTDAHVPAR